MFMSDVKSPGVLPILSVSVVECVNVRSSTILVTSNVPLYPLLPIPSTLVVLLTSTILTTSPRHKSWGISALTVTVEPLVEQVEIYLLFLLNSKSSPLREEMVKS